jgi:hypothetical protein
MIIDKRLVMSSQRSLRSPRFILTQSRRYLVICLIIVLLPGKQKSAQSAKSAVLVPFAFDLSTFFLPSVKSAESVAFVIDY